MVDIVDTATRSRMMAGIKAKNTAPEKQIRFSLFKRGFRYRLNQNNLPGKPDLVFRKYKAIIFVHGCFWHQHNCHLFKWPSSRCEFWKEKLSRNHARDITNRNELKRLGWRITTIWECSIKGRERIPIDAIADQISAWLKNKNVPDMEIRGKGNNGIQQY